MRKGEVKINAKGLSSPGPRLMVERAIGMESIEWIRVIVSPGSVVEDIKGYLASIGATDIEVDDLVDECHVIARLGEQK